MNAETLRRIVVVENSQGLHMRPITGLVELANQFQCQVMLGRTDQPLVNAKSPLSLLGLAAEKGTELVIEISGADGEKALQALVQYFEELIHEDNAEE